MCSSDLGIRTDITEQKAAEAALRRASAEAAAAAGKNFFLEKPLALTLADCNRIVAAVEKAGVIAASGFNLVTSVRRGDKRLVGVVIGGRSGATGVDPAAGTADRGNPVSRHRPEWRARVRRPARRWRRRGPWRARRGAPGFSRRGDRRALRGCVEADRVLSGGALPHRLTLAAGSRRLAAHRGADREGGAPGDRGRSRPDGLQTGGNQRLQDPEGWPLGLQLSLSMLLSQPDPALGIAAIVADSYVQISTTQAIVPFASPWRTTAVAWGTISLWLMVVVQVTSLARRQLSRTAWHRIHILSYLLGILATVHALTSGTDAAHPTVRLSIGIVAAAIAGAIGRPQASTSDNAAAAFSAFTRPGSASSKRPFPTPKLPTSSRPSTRSRPTWSGTAPWTAC